MNDLISRNMAIKAIVDLPNCYNGYSDTFDKACIIGVLEELVSIDAVQVVRCKDCKYWQLEHYVGGQCMSCQMMNSDDVCPTEPTHFCGWAERKEE